MQSLAFSDFTDRSLLARRSGLPTHHEGVLKLFKIDGHADLQVDAVGDGCVHVVVAGAVVEEVVECQRQLDGLADALDGAEFPQCVGWIVDFGRATADVLVVDVFRVVDP